jgi:hypothetical protein
MGAGQHPYSFDGPLEVLRYALQPPTFDPANLPKQVGGVIPDISLSQCRLGEVFHTRYNVDGIWRPISSLLLTRANGEPEEFRRLLIKVGKEIDSDGMDGAPDFYRFGFPIGTVSMKGVVDVHVTQGEPLHIARFSDHRVWQQDESAAAQNKNRLEF